MLYELIAKRLHLSNQEIKDIVKATNGYNIDDILINKVRAAEGKPAPVESVAQHTLTMIPPPEPEPTPPPPPPKALTMLPLFEPETFIKPPPEPEVRKVVEPVTDVEPVEHNEAQQKAKSYAQQQLERIQKSTGN